MPVGFDLAIRAARISAEVPLSDPNFDVAVGTFLFWACSIDGHFNEQTGGRYLKARNNDTNGRLLAGLTLARNAVTHGVIVVSIAPGATWPQPWPMQFPPARWRSLQAILDDWPGRREPTKNQIGCYQQYLDGQPVMPVMQAAIAWLAAIPSMTPP